MHHRTLLIVVAALAASPLAESPKNRSVAGSSHVKSFRESSELQLDSITQTVNGVEVDLGDVMMSAKIERSFGLVDEYVAVEEGRLTKRRRRFEEVDGLAEMSLDVMGERESQTLTLSSPLEGLEVLCEWDEEAEEHSFRFDEDGGGDKGLLEHLLADAEFRMIPPGREAEPKDSWVIDLGEERSFFAPGGLLSWEAELGPGSYEIIEPWQMIVISLTGMSEVSQEIEGELAAIWTETIEVDGVRAAVIALELNAELRADLGDELVRMALSSDLEELDATFEVMWSIEGEGKILWNLEAGHFISLELECENEIEFTLELEEEFGRVEVQAELSGTTSLTATAE